MNDNNSEKDSVVDLNNVIKQVTSSSQFKDIVNNISDKLGQLNEQNNFSNNEPDVISNISCISSNEDNEIENNLENCMTSYFLSKNGENICDCIDKLNNNLEKIISIISNKN